MTDYDVHSTLFFKYLRVNRLVILSLLFIIFIHFFLLYIFPLNRKAVTDSIWIFSELLKISASVLAFRNSRDMLKRSWLFIIIYGFLTLFSILIRSYHDLILNVYTGSVYVPYLFAAGNIALIIAFILFSHSKESIFRIRRQMNLIGIILISILVVSYLTNYTGISGSTNPDLLMRATITGVVNISAFIIGLGIYWTSNWKKETEKRIIFIIILFSTFITFVLNGIFFAGRIIADESVTGGYPDILGTAAMLLICLAACGKNNIKEEFHEEKGYSLFYVSRIERIIPVITLIIISAVLFLNSSRLDGALIKTLIYLMMPYLILLLFFELYSYRSEDALLSVLAVSPTGVHITDRAFKKTYFINKSLFDIFRTTDIPPDLITGNGIKDLEKNKIFDSIAENSVLENFELVLKRPDGTKFNAQCKIIPARFYSYNIVISWIWDITERKKYEGSILRQKYSAESATLYKSELLNNLSNRIQSGYVTMKPDESGWPDFILTGMNKRILELFNFKDDLTGERLRKIFPYTEPGLFTRFFDVLNTGVSVKRELYFKEINKIFIFIIFRASEDEVACLIDDITESKYKQKELVERERELSALLANLPGMVYRCKNDKIWTMYFASQGSIELSGYTPEELEEGGIITWNDLIHPEDKEKVWREGGDAILMHESYYLDYRIITKNAAVKHVWEKGLGVYNENGELLFLEGFIFDITKQKEAEAVLRESEIKVKEIEKAKALGQMAGGIAHDLNNHLMGISSNASLIDLKVKEIDIRKYTGGIQESIRKSSDLIDNLLIFARQSNITADNFSLQIMIRQMILEAADEFPQTIKITSSMNASLDSVKGDYKQLYKAVFDILLNAKDAMPGGGVITITTENTTIDNTLLSDLTGGDTKKMFIVIKISDIGHGIEKEHLSRIFDPFYTTKPVGKGKGLSLSAVYGTIQAHKGAITVDSSPGVGTIFSIFLPVVEG